MPREFNRSARVSAQIQKELALLLQREIRIPEIGMVTVSHVVLSRDLSSATAHVSFLNPDQPPTDCLKRLRIEAPRIRQALGQRIRIRVLPELHFKHDDSLILSERIGQLLDNTHERTKHERTKTDG